MGIDTHGIIGLARLEVRGANQLFGGKYQPTPPADFAALMRLLAIDHSKFVFIDVGSGKGRTLVLAALHPFQRIIGVEFSPELCAVAEKNTAQFRHPGRRCHDVATVCADATEYEFPATPAIIYMYNPFQEAVLARVVRNLEASLAKHPREVFVVYLNCIHRKVLDESPAFKEVASGGPPQINEPWVIYAAKAGLP